MAAVHLADIDYIWLIVFACIPQHLRDMTLVYQLFQAELLRLSGMFPYTPDGKL